MNHPTPQPVRLILPKDWRLGIMSSLKCSDDALIDISRYKQTDSYDDAEAYCRSFVDSSQEAAEHLVKTMLKRRRVPPARTHDIQRLAAQMRAQRSDDVTEGAWAALTARINALNGDAHRDHQAGYGDYQLIAEDITRAATRLSGTFRLLVDEVESALHPHDAPAAMGLFDACLGDDRHQFALAKAGRAIHTTIQSLQADATRVMALTDTPKTADDPHGEGVISFLAHCQPVGQLIAPALIERVSALASTDGCK